jgi:hypothetical protein
MDGMNGFIQLSKSDTNHQTSQMVMAIGAVTMTPVKKYVLSRPNIPVVFSCRSRAGEGGPRARSMQ